MKKKSLIILVTLVLAVLVLSTSVLATGGDLLNPGNVSGTRSNISDKAAAIGNMVLGIMQVAGVAIAVIMLVWLAIKYIMAAPSEKAEIKKGMFIYIVGAILLFGASGVVTLIKNLNVFG